MSLNTKSFRNTSLQWASITDGDQTNLDFTGDFTFETWIKFNSLFATSNYAGITGKFYGENRSWQILMYKSGSISKLRVIHFGQSEQSKLFTWSPSLDTWYHLAVVFDITGDQDIECFVNGVSLGGAQATTNSVTTDSSASVLFGNYATDFSSDYLMDGFLDETIYWNTARTQAQIQAEYNSGNGKIYVGDEAGMVGYWRYEDDLLDETSNNNDLTNNNSGTFSTDIPFVGGGSVNSNFLQFF